MTCRVLAPCIFVLTLLAAALPCPAQQAGATPSNVAEVAATPVVSDSREAPVFNAADVAVRYVRVDNDWSRVTQALSAQAERRFFVRGADGAVSGPYKNVDNFGSVIVLHDHVSLLPELEATLAQLVEVTAAPPETREPLQVIEYRPRHEAVSSLLRALEPFARRIANNSDDSGLGTTAVSNVTMLPEAGVLVLRDTAARLAEMQNLLARIDVPAPQVMLTCLLIQDVPEADGADATAGLPGDLVADLRQLLPIHGLARVGQAALRIAVVPGSKVSLTGKLESGQNFELRLEPTGYDREKGSLSVTQCTLRLDEDALFTTSAVLAAGEHTVLGASGKQPLFVVLRVVPLDD